jgi:hypothetical protein
MRKFSHKTSTTTTEDLFFRNSKNNNSENIAQKKFVIIVINSGNSNSMKGGENWQYYSLERIYFCFFPSSSPPRLLPRLFGLIHLRRNAKSKPAIKIHVMFFFFIFPPTLPAATVAAVVCKRVSWEFTGNFFFISFGFVRKQFQLFQVLFFSPFFKATEKFLLRENFLWDTLEREINRLYRIFEAPLIKKRQHKPRKAFFPRTYTRKSFGREKSTHNSNIQT